MVQESRDRVKARQLLNSVRVGMDVVASTGDKIGKVDDVYFGSSSVPERETKKIVSLADLARALVSGNPIPEVLRQRLLHDGYFRIEGTGLFGGHMYVLPEQIDVMASETIGISATREELIKA